MATTRISSKYQIVIPRGVREEVPVHVGQLLHIVAKGGVITLVPDQPLSELRGSMRGAETGKVRDKADRV